MLNFAFAFDVCNINFAYEFVMLFFEANICSVKSEYL